MSRHPGRIFWKWELEHVSAAGFASAREAALFAYQSPPDAGAVFTSPDGRRLLVSSFGDALWGQEADDETSVEPLDLEMLHRYMLDLKAVAEVIAQRSGLRGKIQELATGCYLLGSWETREGDIAAVLAVLPNTPVAMQALLSLRAQLPARYRKLVVAVPRLDLNETAIRRLGDAGIWPAPLAADLVVNHDLPRAPCDLHRGHKVDIQMRTDDMSVRVNGASLSLTETESRFLRALIEADGSIVPAAAIAKAVWGSEAQLEQLSKYARAVRAKIAKVVGVDPEAMKQVIQNRPRQGYRLNADRCEATLVADQRGG